MRRASCHLIFTIVIYISLSRSQDDKELRLNELFGIEEGQSYAPPANRKRKTASIIDIASLTEDNLNKIFEELYKELGDPKDDKEAVEEYIMHHFNLTRSRFHQTRRYWLPYKPIAKYVEGVPTRNDDWWAAQKHNTIAKTTDNMLTLIYMARYKIKEVERHPMYNVKSIPFKIASVYQKLRNIRRRIRSQWTRMEKAHLSLFNDYHPRFKVGGLKDEIRDKENISRWYDTNVWMANHERIVALHTQFCYFWWVQVRLHEKNCNVNHVYMTKPTERTTGPTTKN